MSTQGHCCNSILNSFRYLCLWVCCLCTPYTNTLNLLVCNIMLHITRIVSCLNIKALLVCWGMQKLNFKCEKDIQVHFDFHYKTIKVTHQFTFKILLYNLDSCSGVWNTLRDYGVVCSIVTRFMLGLFSGLIGDVWSDGDALTVLYPFLQHRHVRDVDRKVAVCWLRS